MTIDKQNGDVCFNEAAHQYFNLKNPQARYISVTTLLGKLEKPFDKDFWSAYKALEQLVEPDYWKLVKKELLNKKKFDKKLLEIYNVPEADFNSVQQNVLDGWQKENLASTTRGTKIHAELEHSMYAQKTDISLQKYGIGGKFTCDQGRTELDIVNGVYPEYLIHYDSPDGKVHIAGQIDLLILQDNSFSIGDYKSNKKIQTTSFFDSKTKTTEKLLYPLNHLDNCNYSIYNMQLSMYAWMIQQVHPEWKCNDLFLIHFDHQNNMTPYHMKYLKDEVETVVKWWKKESILEEHRAKRKRIEY